jgi:hypothetical protein
MTQPFYRDKSKAKVLVIGHDPKLQKSDTMADKSFFANYFFDKIPPQGPERSKYKLAANLYSYIGYLTNYKFTADEIYVTNLCNEELPHAPKGKTVLITEDKAKKGVGDIKQILNDNPGIKIIFALSEQANYWLQYFGLYNSNDDYINEAKPNEKGLRENYYKTEKKSPFLKICGKKFDCMGRDLYPVLHVKQFPLKKVIKKNYEELLENVVNEFK